MKSRKLNAKKSASKRSAASRTVQQLSKRPRRQRRAPAATAKPKKVSQGAQAPKTTKRAIKAPVKRPVRLPTASTPVPESPRSRRISKPLVMPPILLEGDTPVLPEPSGPGERFVLAPIPSQVQSSPAQHSRALPEAYGTQRLFLTARDPHWLYAAWDSTAEQRQSYNSLAKGGHLTLRVYAGEPGAAPPLEIALQPDSKSWFVYVGKGGTLFRGELGYYDYSNQWQRLALSDSTLTPPETFAPEQPVEFVTIPPNISLKTIFQAVQEAVHEHEPLRELVQEVRRETPTAKTEAHQTGQPIVDAIPLVLPEPRPITPSEPRGPEDIPVPRTTAPIPSIETFRVEAPTDVRTDSEAKSETVVEPPATPSAPPATARPAPRRLAQPSRNGSVADAWTPQKAQALAQLIHLDEFRRVWMGSIEITELVRRHLENEISSAPAAGAAARQPKEIAPLPGISSPAEQAPSPLPEQEGFWFKVNAELVIYGATEPDAIVTIGGRKIRLRSDGTFSFRFALPDGKYPLNLTATSRSGRQKRATRLQFSRATQHEGEVGAHPQAADLKPPIESEVR